MSAASQQKDALNGFCGMKKQYPPKGKADAIARYMTIARGNRPWKAEQCANCGQWHIFWMQK